MAPSPHQEALITQNTFPFPFSRNPNISGTVSYKKMSPHICISSQFWLAGNNTKLLVLNNYAIVIDIYKYTFICTYQALATGGAMRQ